ncbi:MAG: YHS domain-containing (seleno)protein [Saprospiraceae bacterium]
MDELFAPGHSISRAPFTFAATSNKINYTHEIIADFSISILFATVAFSQTGTRTKQFNLSGGLAIQGYDPVAYFTQNKAVKGSAQYAATVEGVTYYFASAANKDLFYKNTKKYEPQYGGWCAYAMGATNSKVEIDPATFKIVDGKLYLYFHTWYNNTLTKWNAEEATLKSKADNYWQSIFK